MKGMIVKDWDAVDFSKREDVAQVIGAIQHFLRQNSDPQVIAALQHFTTSGDFPAELRPLIERIRLEKMYDEGWQNLFDVRDFTGSSAAGFDINDVTDGITFRLIPTGDNIRLEKLSGTQVTVYFDSYGGGVGMNRNWLRDNNFWAVEDTLLAFRNKAFFKRADTFYGLIAALPAGQNLAWQAPVPSGLAATDANYVAIRDMVTINVACQTILIDLKDAGLGVSDSSTFYLSAPIQLKSRISRALGLLNAGLAGNEKGLVYNVIPQFTLHYTSGTSYYVCLPKGKNKAGLRQDLELHTNFDMLSNVDAMAGWMRYGGAIAEVNQWQRCATS